MKYILQSQWNLARDHKKKFNWEISILKLRITSLSKQMSQKETMKIRKYFEQN